MEVKIINGDKNTVTLLGETGEKVRVDKDIFKQAVALNRITVVEEFGLADMDKARALGYELDTSKECLYKITGDNSYVIILPKTERFCDWDEVCKHSKNVYLSGGDSLKSMEDSFVSAAVEYIDLSKMKAYNLTSMKSTFSHCKKLKGIKFGGIDTSKVTNMSGMFYNCRSLKHIDLSGLDTSNVRNMSYMFSKAGISTIDLSMFDTSRVHNMSHMFEACSSLTQVNLSSFDTHNVKSINGMFRNCSHLTAVNFSKFDNTSLEKAKEVFFNCYGVRSIGIQNFGFVNYNTLNGGRLLNSKIRQGVLIE